MGLGIARLSHLARFLRLQESQQVDKLRTRDALVETFGHERYARRLDGNDLLSRNANLGMRAGHEGDGIGSVFASHSGVHVALGLHVVDLKARDEAGAREDNGFENIVAGADGAHRREVRPDVSSLVADGVAMVAGYFFAEENSAAAAYVAAGAE